MMLFLINYLDAVGAVAAMIALTAGRLIAITYLFKPSLRSIKG
jgi:hypothetical protein